MKIKLRGHHLLCLLGYRGKGYSIEFCANMTDIYERLRKAPETLITLIEGPDDICEAYPANDVSHCNNESVYRKDKEIAAQVGMRVGEQRSWSAICAQVAEKVAPSDIARLCSDCQWEPYGMCAEGVEHIHRQGQLRSLPE